MTARPRSAGLVIVPFLATLAGALAAGGGQARAADQAVPTAHGEVPSPEPPVADAPPPEAAARCPEDPPVPVVAIRVRVLASAPAGQEVEYRLCVDNRSQAAAHHVLVRDPVPANARFVRATPQPSATAPELLWQLGTLEPGATREIVLVLVPTGPGDVDNCARVQFEHGQCVCTKITRPALRLQKSGLDQAVLYDALTYRLTVTNAGTGEAAGVTLTDTLPPGLEHESGKNQLTWELGKLAPGQSQSVDYQLVAKAAGRLCNRAVATAAGGLREEVEHCVTVGEAKLTLSKTGPARRYLNMAVSYQLTATNPGTAAVEELVITDTLPPGGTFVSASGGGQQVGGEVRWAIGTLAPGASRTVDVVLRAREPGRLCNRATARAARGLTAQAEFCTEFTGVSALLLEVVDTDDPVEVGAETNYIILVRNQGMVPTNEVRIDALVPQQMAVARVAGPSRYRQEGQRLLFEPLTLAPRSDARYVITVKALRPGDVRFKVDLTARELPSGPVHEEESTTVYADLPAAPPATPEGVRQSRRRARP
jgi:uncharacterized repeat protein (TIGR01451 family)